MKNKKRINIKKLNSFQELLFKFIFCVSNSILITSFTLSFCVIFLEKFPKHWSDFSNETIVLDKEMKLIMFLVLTTLWMYELFNLIMLCFFIKRKIASQKLIGIINFLSLIIPGILFMFMNLSYY